MESTLTTHPPASHAAGAFEQELREMNEALLHSVVRQHELVEKAEKAEVALRASEARYRALFDNGPVGIYSCDAAGLIQEFNASAAALWGRAPEPGDPDARFCGSFKLYLPDGTPLPHDRTPVVDVLSGKLPAVHDAEVIIERPDGSRITVLANIVPLKNERGEITGVMNCFYDITDRKRAEDRLHLSEQNLAAELAVTQHLHQISTQLIQADDVEALYEKILDTLVTVMRSDFASIQMFHPERGELRLVGFRGFNAQAAKDWERVTPASQSTCGVALRTGQRSIVPEVRKCEWMAGSADLQTYLGTGIHAVQTTPLVSRSGAVIGMMSTHWREPHDPSASELRVLDALARQATDLIERNQAEERLRQNNNTFFNLIQNAPFGLYVVDDAFRMRQVSTASEKIFAGIRPLIGRDFEEILRLVWAEPFAGEALGRFRHTLATGEPHAAPNTTESRYGDAGVESYDWKIERVTLPDGRYGVVCYFYDITERKRAEAQLRLNHDAFFDLIKNARFGVYVVDAQFRMRQVSAASQKAFANVRPLIGRDFAEVMRTLWVEPFAAEVIAHFRHTLATGEAYDAPNFTHLRGDIGTVESYDWSIERVTLPDGQHGVICYFYDITDIKQAQEALRESQRFLRSSLDALSGHIAVLDEAGTILEVNEAWRRFADENHFAGADYGVGASYLQDEAGMSAEECNLWPCVEGIRDVIAGRRDHFELEYPCHAPTEHRWYTMRVTRFQSPGPARIVVVHDNITARKRTEDALRDSEVRYRRLFEAAKDGILILDFDSGRITDANPYMGELLGLASGAFAGKDLWQVGLFADAAAGAAALATLRDAGYFRIDTLPVAAAGGRPADVELVANVYREDRRRVIQCNIRDVTERSRMEKQLREQAAALAEADRRKDEFLATLAHELRNPLAPIGNGLQVMRLAGTTGPVEQARRMIERQLAQMVRLVDDLLDISRVTTGKLVLRRARVELKAVLDAAVETSRPVIEQAGHDLAVTVPDEPVFLDGDAARLTQVVSNLLNNSAKYTHRGGRIRLTVERSERAVAVSVADDGIGIPPAMLGRVFDLFVQVERALEKTTGGLGIGLSLVKGLVEMHGGTIEARSAGEGEGSEFVVRLPVAVELPSPPPVSAAVEPSAAAPLRILVADDNRDGADSLSLMLDFLGHDTRTAYDGAEAVAAAAAFRPDVVLLDIGMPKLNGYEACRRIREQAGGRTLVVIAQTGWGEDEDRRRTAEAGFDHHLVKPVDPVALLARLAGLTATPA